MAPSIITAILALVGTTIGSVAGILTANKLTNYRIEQLEKKVEKHNSVLEKLYGLESRTDVLEEKVKVANHRIEDLETKKAR